MANCAKCNKSITGLPYTCRYCGKIFCPDHQLPENHDCEGLEKWKKGDLRGFKKDIKSRQYTATDILRTNPIAEPIGRTKLDDLRKLLHEKRKLVIILLVIIFAIVLILLML